MRRAGENDRQNYHTEYEDKDLERRIRRHLAGRYNGKAKWEQLLAEKEVRHIIVVHLTLSCHFMG